ncbi:GGDEF domain-containing protein [Ancylobacter sp. A5.8]|uniref:GGDEF domain-containing protein n=1 Tax=Ancylobacter gelatini TaxID=2919920 RepID=UPI001F4EA44D|nr:GGDEF domain-containing protein [Ancylobacter gelatini]MCJ8141365.1 GGDEF domain-containing protein [Ancylobacter gelatini]
MWVIVTMVAVLAAIAMNLAWLASPRERSLAYWGMGVLFQVLGLVVILLRGHLPEFWVILIGNALLFISYGLMRVGVRQFAGLPLNWHQVLYAPALWMALCLFPAFIASIHVRICLFSLIAATLLALGALDLERVKDSRGIGRWGLRCTLVLMVGLHLARAVLMWGADSSHGVPIISSSAAAWFGLTGMSGLLLASFMLLLMVRERSEFDLRRAAQVDELTGLPNRRGFHERAIAACGGGGAISVALLDIDHFKQVNDRHGHAAGDRVLRAFGQVLDASELGRGVIGRMGGEEFAALLHGLDPATVRTRAEKFCAAFRDESARLTHGEGGARLAATVSIGIAHAQLQPTAAPAIAQARLDLLLTRADAALYVAKASGRDRVEADDTRIA